MKIIILRGKFSKRFFGIQLVCGKYVIQYAYRKFGVFNSSTYTWWPS